METHTQQTINYNQNIENIEYIKCHINFLQNQINELEERKQHINNQYEFMFIQNEINTKQEQLINEEQKLQEQFISEEQNIQEQHFQNNIRLLAKLPQSGKTQVMLNEISQFIESEGNQKPPLSIIICDNSLLLQTQTYKRGNSQNLIKIGSIHSCANGYCQWKSVKSFDNPDYTLRKSKETLKDRVLEGEVNTLIMCSNKPRWNNLKELIELFGNTHNIIIWIDEADKTVGGFDSMTDSSKEKLYLLKKISSKVMSINFITATPFTPKRNWKSHKWIGNNFNNTVELVQVPEIVGNNYHHLCDSHYIQQTNRWNNPCEYAKHYLDENPASPNDIFLIPGSTRQKSHDEIKNMCLSNSRFDFVIKLNGDKKCLEKADVIVCDNTTDQEFIHFLRNEEVNEWLPKLFDHYNIIDKKVAITGNLCISRGITISSNSHPITHMIFGCSSTIREDDQLLSRVCGYCYSSNKKPTVICEEKIWEDVSNYQKVMIKITKKAMSYNRSDRILTDEDLNSMIQTLNSNKRPPYMFENLNMNQYGKLFDDYINLNKEEKQELVKNIIRENNMLLYNFITNSNCKQITKPTSEDSYKKHVTDVYKLYQKNTNCIIDLSREEKRNNCWMGIIDIKYNRIFILVWVMNSDSI